MSTSVDRPPSNPTQPPVAGLEDTDAICDFVHKCASLFVDPDLAATIAHQVAANYVHWRRHGNLCVLLESADTGEITVDDGEWEVEWAPVNEDRTKFEAVLPPVRVGIVSREPNGDWGWAIQERGAACLDDSSGYDTYATPEDAMRAVLHPEDAPEDRWYGPTVREPRRGVSYGRLSPA
jgi:hypothetical protein